MSARSITPADPLRVVTLARGWIGTPYVHQASLKGVGCDCLGLIRGVWRELVGPEPELPPPYSPDWAEAGGRETMRDAAMRHLLPAPEAIAPGAPPSAGDVLLFRWRAGVPAKHCAIASGPDAIIHAHEGLAVAEVALGTWWRRHVVAAFRFPA
jgi:NlpC/P60 family putative phage cell wall peptidase